jgi:very-short-patch-repair endonuclease
MKKSLRSFPASIQNARSLRKSATIPERILWDSLRGRRLNGWKFRRQHPIGQFVVDFFCREKCVAVELDGEVHSKIEVAGHDAERDKFLRLQGVKILRFTNNQVLEDLPRVLEAILKIMEE